MCVCGGVLTARCQQDPSEQVSEDAAGWRDACFSISRVITAAEERFKISAQSNQRIYISTDNGETRAGCHTLGSGVSRSSL